MANEIVVIGKPEKITLGNQDSPTPMPSSDGGPLAFAQKTILIANLNITVEPDASDAEIVVIAQKMKTVIMTTLQTMAAVGWRDKIVNLPCVGSISAKEISSIFNNLKFNITTKNFGIGRAGSNNIGTSGQQVPVEINSTALKGYYALAGGLDYLFGHEIAHALVSMQAYNKQKWDEYVAGPGSGLTYAEQVADYPNSTQFKDNEARANTVGRAIQAFLGWSASGFTPTNGYQSC